MVNKRGGKEKYFYILSKQMKKNKKNLIKTIRLSISLITLTLTILGVLKRFIDWSDNK